MDVVNGWSWRSQIKVIEEIINNGELDRKDEENGPLFPKPRTDWAGPAIRTSGLCWVRVRLRTESVSGRTLAESGEVSEMIPEDVELQICSALINHLHYFNAINTELQQLQELQQRSPWNFSSSPGWKPGEPESNTWYGGTTLITAITTGTFRHFHILFIFHFIFQINTWASKLQRKPRKEQRN